jgi:AcrR family transcriptional regulator
MKQASARKIPTSIKNQSLVEKRREQIFDAVLRLFSEKGYHRTTLREISKATGITLGNLYDYISTKEDILHMIQERATRLVNLAASQKKGGTGHPAEKLRDLIDSELSAMDRFQDLILIIYQESHAMRKDVLYSLLKSERRHLEQFEGLIQEGIRKGIFRPVNARMLSNLIKMLIDSWVIKRWDLNKKITLEQMRQGILDLVFHGIMKAEPAVSVARCKGQRIKRMQKRQPA